LARLAVLVWNMAVAPRRVVSAFIALFRHHRIGVAMVQ
jgi:hypothetical protein